MTHSTISPCAADAEGRAPAHDRQRIEIDARRILPVDRDFGLAGLAALLERREIHERELDRALDLVDLGAGEEDDRACGVDAPHRLVQAVRPGIGKKAEDLGLRVGGWVGGGHALNAPAMARDRAPRRKRASQGEPVKRGRDFA